MIQARYLITLFCLPSFVHGKGNNIVYDYDESASCDSNSYGVSLDYLDIACEGDDYGYCAPGGTVTATGSFTALDEFPSEGKMTIMACKFWGYLCTPALIESSVDLCDEFDLQSDSSCPSAGTYTFEQTYTIPQPTWSDYMVNGFGFNIYLVVSDDSEEEEQLLRCRAQFHTINNSSSNSSAAFAGFALLAMGGLTAMGVVKKRRRRTGQIDLAVEEGRASTGFEMMGDSARC